jgi:polar amino acid transport system substrate-binding protein
MSLKAGLIGCGWMGDIHADCLNKIDDLKITAFCDFNLDSAKKMCEKYNGEYYTQDIDRLMKDDNLDAIYVCTYHDTHKDLAIKCAEAKKNVFMEKPLALRVDEIYEIGNAVEKSGILFMVGLKSRFYPSIKKAKAFITNPALSIGQLIDVPWPDSFWANDPAKGGGNVLSQGCHMIDLVCYFNGSEPDSIFAYGGNYNHPKIQLIDNIAATIKFKNNTIASVTIGDSGVNPLLSKFSLQLFDENKSVHLYDRLKCALFNEGNTQTLHKDEEELAFLEENKYFAHCLKNKISPEITWKDGLRSTLLVLKAFESIKTGKPQDIIF